MIEDEKKKRTSGREGDTYLSRVDFIKGQNLKHINAGELFDRI